MQHRRWLQPELAVVVTTALLGVLLATRRGPLMSPDSVHYLATAEHIRSFRGITDLTGDPMTIFPPVFPLLLTPGGTSLGWARLIGAMSLAVVAVAMSVAVRRVAGRWAGLAAGLVAATSPVLLRVASTVWSEAPYLAISVAALAIAAGRPTRRTVAATGLLAGLGFLTRYAGAGLIAAAAAMVVVAVWPTRRRWVALGGFAAAVGVPIAVWVLRNVVVSGQPLGARFSGGSPQTWGEVFDVAIRAAGETLVGPRATDGTQHAVGWIVVVAVVLAAATLVVAALRRLPVNRLDLGMVVYAVSAIVVPVAARKATSNDIEYRVMSPIVIPVVYGAVRLGAMILGRLRRVSRRLWITSCGVAGALVAVWAMAGVVVVNEFPDTLATSAGNRNEQRFSQALYDAVEALPDTVWVTTNSAHRVWWHTRRDPTLVAFVRPRAGNSLYPMSAEALLARVCQRPTYLAWFRPGNKPDDGPSERRPDLAAQFTVTLVERFDQGELYQLTAPEQRCPQR